MRYMVKEPVSRDSIITDGFERIHQLINNKIKCSTER